MDVAIPTKLAVKFAFSTGIDVEYLFAEALEAYWKATIDQGYDPRKASFKTFANTCVYRHLCSVIAEYRRKYPDHDEISEDMVSPEPSPENVCFFGELVRQLPADSKFVIHIVLEVLDGIPAYRARAAIRKILKGQWTAVRIDEAFYSISVMLKEANGYT
jgi:DNA-directed RNA polymerase specialized sigma24 family protein